VAYRQIAVYLVTCSPEIPVNEPSAGSSVLLFDHISFDLRSFDPSSVIYFPFVLSLSPLVTVIGWFGTTLTFPVEQG
jgi:hypothetical protein